jgi:hypothetical protein
MEYGSIEREIYVEATPEVVDGVISTPEGWEAAVLERKYREHVTGWDYYLPRLLPYVARLVSTR